MNGLYLQIPRSGSGFCDTPNFTVVSHGFLLLGFFFRDIVPLVFNAIYRAI